MKKRWSVKSRKSPDLSSPSRSGEAASPHRSGEPYSPYRSDEGDTSAAASDGVCGGDKGKHWMSRSPSSGEETAVRPKPRRKKVKRRFSDPARTCGDVALVGEGSALVPEEQKHKAFDRCVKISPPSNRPNLQEAGEVSSAPPPGKKEGKRVVSKTGENKEVRRVWVPRSLLLASEGYYYQLKEAHGKGSFDEKETSSGKPKPSSEDHREIAQDEDEGEGGHSNKSLGLRASHSSSSQSVEAREKCSFAEEETSSGLEAEMKPKPSSEAHRKIAQDEVEDEGGHPDKSLGLRASQTSSQSVEAHEKGSFDEEQTSSGIKDEMKPKPSSEDHRKIAQNEDEDEDEMKPKPSSEDQRVHSSKSLSSTVDLSEIAQVEDEEQGRARVDVQALLDLDDDTIRESILHCLSHLEYVDPKDPYSCAVEEPQHVLFERLALYRIRGYELLMDRNLDKLDDASLAQCYHQDILSEEGYFEHYEESLEWYFDPELFEYAGFEDYQRLVVRNDGTYSDWDCFCSYRNSYEIDLAYVRYCDAIANETKWVGDYLSDKTIPWKKVKEVAYLQALKIAADFPNVSPALMLTHYNYHIRKIEYDFMNYRGLDCLYFEIWKRVTKEKIDFTKALSEIYQEKVFPSCTFYIEQDLTSPVRSWTMRHKYDAYVAYIDDSVSDDQALLMIKEAVIEMHPRSKIYVDYVRKKLEIAKEIGLIKEAGPVFSTLV